MGRMVFVFVHVLALSLARAEPPGTARLDWMEGHWTGSQDGLEMEEIWTAPDGGALLGMHKDVKAGKMVSFEFLRIDQTPEGLAYLASPRSAPPTPFKLVAMEDRRVVFANEKHDFPQRILYWLDEKGAMHARIEGTRRGEKKSEEWVWARAR